MRGRTAKQFRRTTAAPPPHHQRPSLSNSPCASMSTVYRNQRAAAWNPINWIAQGIVALLAMSAWKRFCFLIALCGMIVLAVHLFGTLVTGFQSARRALPISAADRAPLLARDWAAGDSPGMMQFVRPADAAKLQAWIVANPVPAAIAALPPANRRFKTISSVKDDADGAVVKVRITSDAASAGAARGGTASAGTASVGTASGGTASAAPAAVASSGTVLRLAWTFSAGHWFFTPTGPSATQAAATQPAAAQQAAAYNPRPAPSADRPIASTVYQPAQNEPAPQGSGRTAPVPVSRNVVVPSTVPPWLRTR